MPEPANTHSYPATALQAGMIFHALAHPNSGVDIEHVAMSIKERLDLPAFTSAWNRVIALHPILRTRFEWQGMDVPRQIVSDEFELSVRLLDWSGLNAEDIASTKRRLMREDRTDDYQLDVEVPMRMYVAKLSEAEYWILWSFHHVLLDGRSFPLVLKEVFNLLDGIVVNAPADSRPFKDYVEYLNTQDLEEAAKFWAEKLSSVESPSSMPSMASLNNTSECYSSTHAAIETNLSKDLTDKLRELADVNSVGLNSLVQSAWALLLHHYSQQETVVFGATRAIRHALPGTSDMIGLLINTVPFCVEFTESLTVTELLGAVRNEQVLLRQGETSPLPLIQAQTSSGSASLFDSLLMYDEKTLNSRMHEEPSAQPATRRFDYEGQTNYLLTLLAYGEAEMHVRLEYAVGNYDRPFCQKLLQQMENILSGFVQHPAAIAIEIPYLTDVELKQLKMWNQSDQPYDLNVTLHQLFEFQVRKTPNMPAVRFDGVTQSYSEFNGKVNKLAHHLRQLGVRPDDLVGVLADRSQEMLIAIYAVLKAGGAYVPFDTEFPSDRLAFMVEDSGVNIVLTQQQHMAGFPNANAELIDLHASEVWDHYPDTNPTPVCGPANLAYMLYTSGSTGKPKGAMNEHRGIVNRLLWMQDAFQLDKNDSVLQKTPYTFDVSVWELFWPMQVGARLVVAKPGGHRDTDYLAATIIEERITTLHFVPSMLQLFVEEPKLEQCESIKRIICSGEALPRDLQNKLFARIATELHNLYGPTEAAIDVTWWACNAESPLSHIPIGRTIANTQIHILDKQLNPVPVGVAGELHIAGVQVARGYRNRPELNAERFIDNPFDNTYKMYKTGDLAQFMPDGNIEYLGRLDFQVKIRGLRIELGEIEAVLTSHPSISEVVVTAARSPSGDYQLVAYLVGRNAEPNGLRAFAGKFLADYMLPTQWVVLERFPLNASGKVDRKKLPAPDFSGTASNSPAIAPENVAEKKVLSIWQAVLGADNLSMHDTFFDVGGNSLLVIRLSHQLSAEFNRKISVQDLLRETTIAKQAAFISEPKLKADTHVTSATNLAEKQKAARARRRRPLGGRA